MSSEPHRNFFLIAMDKLVYKYDLVSKELLFQFHTNAEQIHLYDLDDKLVVVSRNEIRLWDFYDHKEEAPELITAMNLGEEDAGFEFDRVFTNKNSMAAIDPKKGKPVPPRYMYWPPACTSSAYTPDVLSSSSRMSQTSY